MKTPPTACGFFFVKTQETTCSAAQSGSPSKHGNELTNFFLAHEEQNVDNFGTDFMRTSALQLLGRRFFGGSAICCIP